MKAVIFDMDGVISDTQTLYSNTESAIVARYGIQIAPEEISRRFSGMSDEQEFTEIFSEAGKERPAIAQIAKQRREILFAVPQREIRPMPGSLELIQVLSNQKIPLAVASGSSLEFIRHVLNALDVSHYFSVLTSNDEVENGKPAPDIFLLAAKRLGMKSADCVVIEDGKSGMIAAHKAGMKCVGLLTHVSEEGSPSELKVRDLRELSVEQLFSL